MNYEPNTQHPIRLYFFSYLKINLLISELEVKLFAL